MRWSWLVCVLVLCGCGGLDGSASGPDRAEVRKLLRNVRDVACTHPNGVTRCEVRVRKTPVGHETWHCEFPRTSGDDLVAYSGADACWTADGSQKNLRLAP